MIIMLFFGRGAGDVLTICIFVFVDELIKGSLQNVFFWIVKQHLILQVSEKKKRILCKRSARLNEFNL